MWKFTLPQAVSLYTDIDSSYKAMIGRHCSHIFIDNLNQNYCIYGNSKSNFSVLMFIKFRSILNLAHMFHVSYAFSYLQ